MIYKNDKIYKLKASDYNLEDDLKTPIDINKPYLNKDKNAVFLKMKDAMPNWYWTDEGSKVYKRARKFNHKPVYQIIEGITPVKIRYAETVRVIGKNTNSFLPVGMTIPVKGRIEVKTSTQPDLWWWYMNHPRLAGGVNQDKSKKPWFYLEDKARELEINLNNKKLRRKAEQMIFDTLTEDELRNAAKIMKFRKTDDLSFAELQDKMGDAVMKRAKEFLALFNKKEEKVETNKTKILLQECKDLEVLVYYGKTNSWLVKSTRTGEADAVLCSMKRGTDKDAFLEKFINESKDPELVDDLKERVEMAREPAPIEQ